MSLKMSPGAILSVTAWLRKLSRPTSRLLLVTRQLDYRLCLDRIILANNIVEKFSAQGANLLLVPDIPFCRLHRCATKQKLDLFQFAASCWQRRRRCAEDMQAPDRQWQLAGHIASTLWTGIFFLRECEKQSILFAIMAQDSDWVTSIELSEVEECRLERA